MKSKFKLALGAILIVGGLTNCTSAKVSEGKAATEKVQEKVATVKTLTTVAKVMDAESFTDSYEAEEYFSGSRIGLTLDFGLDKNSFGKGTKGLAYSYDVAEEGYTGATIRFEPVANWQGATAVRMYMKKDSSGNKAVLQFKENNGEYWETSINLLKDEAGEVIIPLTEFKQPGWGGKVDGKLDLSQISEFSIYINEVKGQTKVKQGKLVYDDIELVK